jgi:hypothetical protein
MLVPFEISYIIQPDNCGESLIIHCSLISHKTTLISEKFEEKWWEHEI